MTQDEPFVVSCSQPQALNYSLRIGTPEQQKTKPFRQLNAMMSPALFMPLD
jgi:hypothetical protein